MLRHAALLVLACALAAPVRARTVQKLPSVEQAREFRLKMLSDYGVATWDDLVLARQCRRCGWLAGRQTLMPGLSRPRSIPEWLARIGDAAGRTLLHRRCAGCGATPAGPGFRTVCFSGMAFLEAGADLQMTVHYEPKQRPAVRLALVKTDGAVRDLPWPLPAAKFEELAGVPFSVRSAWHDFLTANRDAKKPVFRRVEDGYYLVLAPAPDGPGDVERVKKDTVAVLDQLGKQAGALHVEALADLEEQKRPIRQDTYHDWLPDFAPAIAAGELSAMAAVHPGTFMQVLAREAERLGVTAALPRAKGTDVTVSRGDVHLTIPCSGAILRTIHQGLSFEQGVAPLLEEVNRVRAMHRLARRVGELVARRYLTEIVDGHRLRFKAAQGQRAVKGAELDLAALAGKLDLGDDRKAAGDRLARLIGLDPATGEFQARPPAPGTCSCGKPASPALKLRPAGFAPAGQVLAVEEHGVLVAAVHECPDHIQYLKPGAPYADMQAARAAFDAGAASLVFPITGVGLVPFRGVSLPYALGPDLSTAALDAGLAAGLLATLDGHFGTRPATPPRARLPAPDRTVHVAVPFQHVVVFSPHELSGEDRDEVARLVRGALEGPTGRVDPGPALAYVRTLALDKPARGRFERR